MNKNLIISFVANRDLRSEVEKQSQIINAEAEVGSTMTVTCPDGSVFSLKWDAGTGGLQVQAERGCGDEHANFILATPWSPGALVLIAKAEL